MSPVAQAQRTGRYNELWQVIPTEHFEVVVSAQQHDLGLHYAHIAEMAYQNLAQVFTQTDAQKKIVLVVNDTTDVVNGYATRIPYPHIMAYTVPVDDHDSISEAGDWARELITHELAHILQMEPASDFYLYLRPIFGNIIAPNMLTPRWWKEGMSVEMETQFSPRGRLRSVFQDTTIRSLVLDKKLNEQSLPRANEALPSWPYGGRSYLFGSLFFSQLSHDTKNNKVAGQLANRQGELPPYFIQLPMNELTHNNYETQYDKALLAAEAISLAQIEKLKTLPTSDLQNIELTNESSLRPNFSEKFKLLAYIENVEAEDSLAVLDEKNLKLKLKNLPAGDLLSLDFHPTEKKILYTKIDKIDSAYTLSDLHVYDLDSEKSEQLTTAQRARSASYSAGGTQAVFITSFSGKTQIRTIDLATKAVKFIADSGATNRYESPIFWDEQNLLVSKSDANGVHRIFKINLVSLVESPIALGSQNSFPQMRFLKKINNSLYFISSKNGVNNLYVSKDLATAKPVSHVLDGIWSYDISPDETAAWASLLTSRGFKISKLKLANITHELPHIESPIQKRYSFKESEYIYKKYPAHDYAASAYLLPSYWIPFFSASSGTKGVFLQAMTSGHDPIKKHEYTLSASYDSESNKVNFSGVYLNSTQSIPFQLSSVVDSRALGLATEIVQTSTYALSLLPDVFSIHKNLLFQAGLQLQNTNYKINTQHAGPFTQIVYKNYAQNIFQISPEKGWGSLLKFEKNYKSKNETDQEAGLATRDYEKLSFSWVGFTKLLLPKHHALKAKISGLMTSAAVLAQYGDSTASSVTVNAHDGLIPQFVMRGYAHSQFFGRSLWNTNLEYRFPIQQLEIGSGVNAYFFKRVSGAIIADGLGVDGAGLTSNLVSYQNLKPNESLWNTGVEVKLETTIGYILPVNFILGCYVPHSPVFASGPRLGFSLQIGGF